MQLEVETNNGNSSQTSQPAQIDVDLIELALAAQENIDKIGYPEQLSDSDLFNLVADEPLCDRHILSVEDDSDGVLHFSDASNSNESVSELSENNSANYEPEKRKKRKCAAVDILTHVDALLKDPDTKALFTKFLEEPQQSVHEYNPSSGAVRFDSAEFAAPLSPVKIQIPLKDQGLCEDQKETSKSPEQVPHTSSRSLPVEEDKITSSNRGSSTPQIAHRLTEESDEMSVSSLHSIVTSNSIQHLLTLTDKLNSWKESFSVDGTSKYLQDQIQQKEERIAVLQESLQLERELKRDLLSETKKMTNTISRLKELKNELKRANIELQSMLSKKRKEPHSAENSDIFERMEELSIHLEEENHSLNQKIKEFQNEFEEAQDYSQLLEIEKSQLQESEAELQTENEELLSTQRKNFEELQSVSAQKIEVERQNSSLRQELQKLKSKMRSKESRQSKSKSTHFKDLCLKHDQLKLENVKLKREKANFQLKLEKEIEKIQAKSPTSEVSELRRKIENLEKSRKLQEKEHENKVRELVSKHGKISKIAGKISKIARKTPPKAKKRKTGKNSGKRTKLNPKTKTEKPEISQSAQISTDEKHAETDERSAKESLKLSGFSVNPLLNGIYVKSDSVSDRPSFQMKLRQKVMFYEAPAGQWMIKRQTTSSHLQAFIDSRAAHPCNIDGNAMWQVFEKETDSYVADKISIERT